MWRRLGIARHEGLDLPVVPVVAVVPVAAVPVVAVVPVAAVPVVAAGRNCTDPRGPIAPTRAHRPPPGIKGNLRFPHDCDCDC